MTPRDPFFRIVCVTADPAVFTAFAAATWSRSGLTRWSFLDHANARRHPSLHAANLILIDCSGDQVLAAAELDADLPDDKCWLIDFSGRHQARWNAGARVLDEPELGAALDTLTLPRVTAPIHWNCDPDMQLIRPALEPALALALEKYFPERTADARVHKVVDGWSGTPLVRISIDGEQPEYFLKFFDHQDEFIAEWNGHVRAMGWFGPYVVQLRPVDAFEANGLAQSAAFPRGGAPDAKHYYPICYWSATVSATLRELYRERDDDFALDAFKEVVTVFEKRQPATIERRRSLADLPDVGPGRRRRPKGQRTLDSLRGSEYLSFIQAAESELRPYEQCLGEPWTKGLDALHDVLHVDQPWITEPVELALGRVHGDANARNFLFHRTADRPLHLQVIDCGCCEDEGPLVLDLAQMEADLKIVLMGTDKHASNFRDIDSRQLAAWIAQEEAALADLRGFKKLQRTPRSTWRAYQVVSVIRDRAAALSPRDADGRAYFFHLLYWTLRKVRHQHLPHVKRILALYSACQICLNMRAWKRP